MSADPDVVVAGGGVAGCAAAAGLASLGWSVLLVEPGQHDERRLAGELIHPAGVAGLAELGLLAPADIAGAARLSGFAVFADRPPSPPIHLLYPGAAGASTALALDHPTLRRTLLDAAGRLGGVTVARGSRVVGLAAGAGGPCVFLARGGCRERVRCRVVVAADGASSGVRRAAGIAHRRGGGALFTGYRVDSDALAAPGFGHAFLAAQRPVLAYAIGGAAARVLFEQPLGSGRGSTGCEAAMAALPAALRSELAAEFAAGRGLRAAGSDIAVAAVARRGVVLVGDAAGSCHPLTASGMAMAVADALRLRQALHRHAGDIDRALARYARQRRAEQRARMLLAALLRDTLGGAGPGLEFLRDALIRYWQRSPDGRAASMRLIAASDTRIPDVLFELARVARHGLGRPGVGLARQVGAMARLPVPILRLMGQAMSVP